MSQSTPSQNQWFEVTEYDKLRLNLGRAGIAFPFVVALGAMALSDCIAIQGSISAYYHTIMGPVFVGFLCAFAMFLFTYHGKHKQDRVAFVPAGICAMLVALFPCELDADSLAFPCQVQPFPLLDKPGFMWMHYGSALAFFLLQVYIAAFLFTKTKAEEDQLLFKESLMQLLFFKKDNRVMDDDKRAQNNYYRWCARTQLISLVLIGIYVVLLRKPFPNLTNWHPIFWLEIVGLTAFGMAWIIKSKRNVFNGQLRAAGERAKQKKQG
jgi:hypothetical protein